MRLDRARRASSGLATGDAAPPASQYWLVYLDPTGDQYAASPAVFGVTLEPWLPPVMYSPGMPTDPAEGDARPAPAADIGAGARSGHSQERYLAAGVRVARAHRIDPARATLAICRTSVVRGGQASK